MFPAWALSLMMKLVPDWLRARMLPRDWSHLTYDDRAKKVAKEFLNETGSERKEQGKTHKNIYIKRKHKTFS